MRLPRFTILQLLLAATLVALVLGLVTASWRVNSFHHIEQVAFSPGGTLLAAKYSGGAVQVWRIGGSRPRLVAQAFGRARLLGFDSSTIHFLSEDKLLKLEPEFSAGGMSTRLRELTISTREVREAGRIAGQHAYPGFQLAGGKRVVYIDWQNTGHVCGFNVETQTVDRRWSLGAAAAQLALSADGGTLAATDQNGVIHVIDVENDERRNKFPGGGLERIAMSGDGRFLAAPQSAAAPASGTAVIFVHATASGAAPAYLVTELPQVWSVGLSADGSRLAAIGSDAIECYDVHSKQRLARVLAAGAFVRIAAVQSREFGNIVLSPDGGLLASVRSGQIRLHDVPGGRLAHVITGGPRWLHIVIFTLGFALWSAGWGIVAKRERARRPATPQAGPAPVRKAPTPQAQARTVALALVGLVLMAIVSVLLYSVSRPPSLGLAFEMLGYLAGGLVVVLALGAVYYWLVRWLMGPHYFTLLRLRQIAGTPGRLLPRGGTLFWFAAPSPYEAEVGPIFDEVAARTRMLFGTQSLRRTETLVAWLDRQCDLDAFLGRHVPIAAVVPNVWSARTAVVCEETALRNFGRPTSALRAAVALLFSIRIRRGLLPGWVAGLVSRQLCQDEESPAELRAAIRRMKVLLARRPDWNPRVVLLRPDAQRRDLWLGLEEAAAWREVQAEIDFLATLGPLLFGPQAPPQRREKALAWLRALRRKDDPVATLERALGVSLNELLGEWRESIDRGDALAYDAAPPERLRQLQLLTARRIADRTQPAAERARAVRCLGGTSYAGAAGVLIELLADPRCEFREEAIRSLENLSGRTLGDDLAAWRAWWDSLRDEEVRWQSAGQRAQAGLAASGLLSGVVSTALANRGPAPLPPTPLELRMVYGLMAIGGLIALAIPIAFMFLVGPLLFVTIYFSLLVGVQALARGAARDPHNLSGVANLQAANILACDPINLLLSIVEHALLRREPVQQYLAQASSGGLNQRGGGALP